MSPPLHVTPSFMAWEDTFTLKLLFALLVVSALTLKVEGADVAYNAECIPGNDTCTTANTECKDDGDGNIKCLCSTNYTHDGSSSCKKDAGQACTEATKADCLSGTCTDEFCGGSKDNDAECDRNTDCKSLNCKFMDGSDTCAEAASAAVVASVTLMLVTLVATRIL